MIADLYMWPLKNLKYCDIKFEEQYRPEPWESHVCPPNNVCFTFLLGNNGIAEWPVGCLIHRAPPYQASWKRGLTEKLWLTVGGGVSAETCANTHYFSIKVSKLLVLFVTNLWKDKQTEPG